MQAPRSGLDAARARLRLREEPAEGTRGKEARWTGPGGGGGGGHHCTPTARPRRVSLTTSDLPKRKTKSSYLFPNVVCCTRICVHALCFDIPFYDYRFVKLMATVTLQG